MGLAIAIDSPEVRGHYFMSDSERDAEIGRAFARRKDVEAQIAALLAAAQRIGTVFQRIGTVIQRNPESLAFEQESSPGGFGTNYIVQKSDQKDINPNTLRALVSDLQALLTEKSELDKRLN